MLEHLRIRHLGLAIVIVASAIGVFVPNAARSDTLAFPGAVGQGAAAVGGRGGDVYHVTNLSDYSEDKGETKIQGSLRHAIRSAKGPRTVVFDVGGAIQLHDPLEINKSKITIAGQTSPGGVTVYGYPCNVSKASDVVIRYIRMRTGDFNARAPRDPRAAQKAAVGKGAKDLDAGTANGFDVGRGDRVILDHVSTAWGMDETLSVTLSRNVTIQNTIIAESLNSSFHPKGPHGYGTLVRGELTPADQEAGTGGYTFYGNLWAFHRARNPSIGGQQRLAPDQSEDSRRRADVNIVNNVIYGWGDQPTHRNEFGDVRINLVGNYYINGKEKKSDYIFRESNPARTFLFGAGNFHDADQDSTHNGKAVGLAADLSRTFHEFDEQDQLLTPSGGKPYNFFATVDDSVMPAEAAYARVVSHVGASLSRDAIDNRIIESVIHRAGSLIDSQDKLRGPEGKLPGIDDLPATQRPADFDTDRDGMSNAFELEHGLNPNDAADGNGNNLSKDGYTNLEVYLNSLVPADKHP
jgi:hypothetical protein